MWYSTSQKGERVTLWQWHLLIWLRRATFWRWCWMERYNGRGWSTLTLREGKESTAPHHLRHHFGRQCIGILLCWVCLPVRCNMSPPPSRTQESNLYIKTNFSFLPVKLFPWLLENEESQVKDGLRFYPRLLTWAGTQINLVESYKEESKFRSITTPLAILATGIILRVSYGSDVSEYIQ